MKTKIPLGAALMCGLTGIAGAFTLDFVGYEGAALPPVPLTLSVPVYGDMVIEAAEGPALVVCSAYQNDDGSSAPSLDYDESVAVKVTFKEPATAAMLPEPSVSPELSRERKDGADSTATVRSEIPEPTSLLSVVLAWALCALARRR